MDFYTKCEIQDEFFSGISSPVHCTCAPCFLKKRDRIWLNITAIAESVPFSGLNSPDFNRYAQVI